MPDYPTLLVEWLPAEGPGTVTGSWSDITEYVTEGSINRGRQYELEQFQAGTCQLTLMATTRLFDPENTAGAYYGNLVPMRQLRISATWNAVSYPLFRGYITDWGQTVPQDTVFVTTINVADGFVRLEQLKLPSSAWALEVLQTSPSCWFRLNESDTPRVTDSSDGGFYGLYDNCEQGVEGLVVNDGDGAVAFAHLPEERVTIQSQTLMSAYPCSMSVMFKCGPVVKSIVNGGYENRSILTAWTRVGALDGISVSLDAPGTLGFVVGSSLGSAYYVTATSSVYDDGLPHHLVWTLPSAAGQTVYVDGAAVTLTVLAATGTPTLPTSVVGGYILGNYIDVDYPQIVNGFGTQADDGSIAERGVLDEFVVWQGTALSSGTVAALALAAKTGWEGDDTGTRVTRFLDAIDWPASLRDIDTGISLLGPASWSAGATALSVLQGWADTEFGLFHIDREGKIVWRSRHFRYLDATSTTSQATFGDRHSAATLKYDTDGFELPRDEALIRNPVQASRANGITVTVKDQTLIDNKYGDRTWPAPITEDRDDATVRDRATWLLARYKELGSRLARMQITPRRSPSLLWPQVLGREIGERITVKRTPLGLNSEISVDQIIEGITHQFSPMQWTTTFRGSPLDPGVGDYLILNDATYGKLDVAAFVLMFLDVGQPTRLRFDPTGGPIPYPDDGYPAIIADAHHAYGATTAAEVAQGWAERLGCPPTPDPRPVVPYINRARWLADCPECQTGFWVWDEMPSGCSLTAAASTKSHGRPRRSEPRRSDSSPSGSQSIRTGTSTRVKPSNGSSSRTAGTSGMSPYAKNGVRMPSALIVPDALTMKSELG